SGTPATLLSPTRSATAARAGAGQPAQGGPPAAFRAPFGGTILQSSGSQSSGSQASGDGGSAATVEVAGSVEGGSGGSLRVVLSGTPAQGGGVVLSSGRGSWRTAAGELYSGPVTSLQGGRVGMTLAGPGGSVTLTLVVSAGAGRQVGGIVIVARAPSAGSSS
ncbi:MAG: hypothetical protein ACRDYD_09230, partial [Acidimicrobiales bacterium]